MKFMIADTFTKSLARLDHTAQALVKQAAFDFQLHPAHPGFHFHRLERARDKQLWSFRVTDDLRKTAPAKHWYSSKWVKIGLVAGAGAVVTAVILANRGGGSTTLTAVPGFPTIGGIQ